MSEAASTATMVPSRASSPPSNPAPPTVEVVGASGRSDRSVVAFALVSIVLTVTLGTWLKAHGERSTSASSDVAVLDTPAGDGSPSMSATPRTGPSPTLASVGPIERAHIGRRSVDVGIVPMSFRVPTNGWEAFGDFSINKSAFEPRSAEAIVFWTSIAAGPYAKSCGQWWGSPVGSVADFAAGAAAQAGTGLVMGPSDVSIGGFPAQHLVFIVRKDPPCQPGFFYRWHDRRGAFWSRTDVGDTINVWIVDVDGTRIFIESEMHERAGPELEQEIRRIVGSIRFN